MWASKYAVKDIHWPRTNLNADIVLCAIKTSAYTLTSTHSQTDTHIPSQNKHKKKQKECALLPPLCHVTNVHTQAHTHAHTLNQTIRVWEGNVYISTVQQSVTESWQTGRQGMQIKSAETTHQQTNHSGCHHSMTCSSFSLNGIVDKLYFSIF